MQEFEAYYHALKQHKPDEITEHSLRPALEQILANIKQQENPKVKILHEPKRLKDYGAPDFKITLHEGILGYVENKALGVNLEEVLKSEQIERYKKLSDNILLTNYLDWIWIKNGKIQSRASMCSLNELLQTKHQIEPAKEQQVKEIISNFLSTAPQGVSSPKTLANALGQRGKLLKTYLFLELQRQEKEETEGKLFGLYNTFKRMVDHELKLEDFSDTFAQMLVYGLFMARLNSGSDTIDLFNVEKYIPTSFELIHELVGFLKVLDNKEYAETRWIVEEVLAVLNTMDLLSITSLLSFDKNNKKADPETARDPYVYFYEDFLAAYDKALKKARGVYYTPPAVVNFIIRAVNDVLKDTFGIEKGLADHKNVTLLDFACGTGTFLLEAIRLILDETPPAKRELIVKEHILKNLYGFEYMIAPYTVAHLKLTQYLKDRRYELSDEERVRILLTNTLEHFEKNIEGDKLLPAFTKESRNAREVKNKTLLVITGNPPYNIKSSMAKSKGKEGLSWIDKALEQYYQIETEPINEVNSKIIRNDYVKFWRFAEWKMENVTEGVVAIITQNSFIDKPVLRAMRYHLSKTFDQLYVLNLHGDYREQTGENKIEDENVFDIKEGVAISIFIKCENLKRKVCLSDLIGTRLSKYSFLSSNTMKSINWNDIQLVRPEYKFQQIDTNEYEAYRLNPSIKDIFSLYNSGVKTHRNHFAIAFTRDELIERIHMFSDRNYDDSEIISTFKLKDTRDWKLAESRKLIMRETDLPSSLKPYVIAPFDTRNIVYDDRIVELPRHEIVRNFTDGNIALLGTRNNNQKSNAYVFVTNEICDVHTLEDSTNVYPLYVFREEQFLNTTEKIMKTNIRKVVFELVNIKYSSNSSRDVSSELIFGYIYSVLHSYTYRNKYKDFLKTDFPRIPFCEDYSTFEQLSQLGWRLINAHLMKSPEPAKQFPELGQYKIKGDNLVDKVFYTDHLQRLNINATQYFEPVPPEIYSFHIGGYQVLNKYLKDRKGRTLSLDEIDNVENIVRILAFTREIMQEIDDKTKEWI